MAATQKYYREGAKLREEISIQFVYFLRESSLPCSFAVRHLTITDRAAKRRDLGKSWRGEKNLQDINEGPSWMKSGLWKRSQSLFAFACFFWDRRRETT
jgi:hypothetical protein